MTVRDWTKPTEVEDLDLVFGSRALDLMPPMSEIPGEFKSHSFHSRNKWVRLQQDWFFSGLRNAVWTAKSGIDKNLAVRHLRAIQCSFEPKHEHKEAAVAYLASLWFDDVAYEGAVSA